MQYPLLSSQVQLCSSAPAHSLQERRRWAAQPLARDAAIAVVNLTQPQSQHHNTPHRTGIVHNFSGRQAEQHELPHSLAGSGRPEWRRDYFTYLEEDDLVVLLGGGDRSRAHLVDATGG